MKTDKKIVLSSFVAMILLLGIVVGYPVYKTVGNKSILQGFTEQQIQAANNLSAKNLADAEKHLKDNLNNKRQDLPIQAGGSNNLYANVCCVENWYSVQYSTYPPASPTYLEIAIKTEIWNASAYTAYVGGVKSISTYGGFVSYNVYFWSYTTNGWVNLNLPNNWGWADDNGQIRVGMSIPYGISDKFYIEGYPFILLSDGWHFQKYQKFFTVNWT